LTKGKKKHLLIPIPIPIPDNPDVKEFYMGIIKGGGRKSFKDVKSHKRRKRWM